MTRPASKRICPSCCGKVRYRDQKEAQRALHLILSSDDKRTRTPKRAYECPGCKGWHLTRQGKKN